MARTATFIPRYTISNEILNNIAAIEAAREVILAAPLIPRYEVGFRRDAMERSVHHATHIEGNPLGEETVKKVLASEQDDRDEKHDATRTVLHGKKRHYQEVINYRRVLDFIEAVVENRPAVLKKKFGIDDLRITGRDGGFTLTQDVIVHMHEIVVNKIVPDEEAGDYRGVGVVLRNTATGEVSYQPPAYQDVQDQMDEFISWVTSPASRQVHPILRAGVVHYELARIHPFTEGNGRTARAAATLVMYIDGYDIRQFFSLEEYFDRNPREYFGTLQHVSNQLVEDESERDLTVWLEYFTRGVAEEFNRVKDKVQRLSLDVRLKGQLGKQIELSERQVKLIEFLEANRRIKNEDFRKVLPMVSEDTVRRDLKELIDQDLVVKKGKTKAARYELRSG